MYVYIYLNNKVVSPPFPDGTPLAITKDTPGAAGVLVVSTTRPETVPADVAVMVHPSDPRYTHLVGRRVFNPCRPGVTMPVIADEAVDVALGTGGWPGYCDVMMYIYIKERFIN